MEGKTLPQKQVLSSLQEVFFQDCPWMGFVTSICPSTLTRVPYPPEEQYPRSMMQSPPCFSGAVFQPD